MALGAKLQLRQSQSLVMTPQLMQSIRLLQLTHAELERFIDEEIERNPLLERAERQDDAGDEPAADGGDPFVKGLSGNAVWKQLPFVTAGNVHRLPDGIWMFGGPTSMTQYVDAVVAALGR